MSDPPVERLGSLYLEDLAIVALTSRVGVVHPRHPNLGDERRTRLRSRLKQISRHDWPANLREDGLVRRGYTLRQCFRLLTALSMIDAYLPPSIAIAIARANELAFLRLIVGRLADVDPGRAAESGNDAVAVILLGELVELVAEDQWRGGEPQRVRLIERSELPLLWSDVDGLDHAGQRLVLDVGTVATNAWQWIEERRLMTRAALDRLGVEVELDAGDDFVPLQGPARRR